jgi:site-specific recombinase XerD
VHAHVTYLKRNGVPASSINQRLAAIRKLALELADNKWIDESTAQSIKRIKNEKRRGQKLGNWLTQDQARAMLDAPNPATLKGKRDRAILSVMLGCGLRRQEVADLTVDHLQVRELRWVILDLEGKHERVRTVPMAEWVKGAVNIWMLAAGINTGWLFLPMRKGDRLQPGPMSTQAVWSVVQQYAQVPDLAPHDLRRTFAKLAHQAGAPIEQIQLSLGHQNIATTERYLGVRQDLRQAPSDYIHL